MSANTTNTNLYHDCIVEVARSYFGEWADWIILGSTVLYKQLTMPFVWSFTDIDMRVVIAVGIVLYTSCFFTLLHHDRECAYLDAHYLILERLARLDDDKQLRTIRSMIIKWNKECEIGPTHKMGHYIMPIKLRPPPDWASGEELSGFSRDEEKEIGDARMGFYPR
jgi:hypothetical protein